MAGDSYAYPAPPRFIAASSSIGTSTFPKVKKGPKTFPESPLFISASQASSSTSEKAASSSFSRMRHVRDMMIATTSAAGSGERELDIPGAPSFMQARSAIVPPPMFIAASAAVNNQTGQARHFPEPPLFAPSGTTSPAQPHPRSTLSGSPNVFEASGTAAAFPEAPLFTSASAVREGDASTSYRKKNSSSTAAVSRFAAPPMFVAASAVVTKNNNVSQRARPPPPRFIPASAAEGAIVRQKAKPATFFPKPPMFISASASGGSAAPMDARMQQVQRMLATTATAGGMESSSTPSGSAARFSLIAPPLFVPASAITRNVDGPNKAAALRSQSQISARVGAASSSLFPPQPLFIAASSIVGAPPPKRHPSFVPPPPRFIAASSAPADDDSTAGIPGRSGQSSIAPVHSRERLLSHTIPEANIESRRDSASSSSSGASSSDSEDSSYSDESSSSAACNIEESLMMIGAEKSSFGVLRTTRQGDNESSSGLGSAAGTAASVDLRPAPPLFIAASSAAIAESRPKSTEMDKTLFPRPPYFVPASSMESGPPEQHCGGSNVSVSFRSTKNDGQSSDRYPCPPNFIAASTAKKLSSGSSAEPDNNGYNYLSFPSPPMFISASSSKAAASNGKGIIPQTLPVSSPMFIAASAVKKSSVEPQQSSVVFQCNKGKIPRSTTSISSTPLMRRDLVVLVSSAELSSEHVARQSRALAALNEKEIPLQTVDVSNRSQTARGLRLLALSGVVGTDCFPQFFFDFVPVTIDEESGNVREAAVTKGKENYTVFWGGFDKFEESRRDGTLLDHFGLFSRKEEGSESARQNLGATAKRSSLRELSNVRSGPFPPSSPLFIAASSSARGSNEPSEECRVASSVIASNIPKAPEFPNPPNFIAASSSSTTENNNGTTSKASSTTTREFPAFPNFIAASEVQVQGDHYSALQDPRMAPRAATQGANSTGRGVRYPPLPNFIAASSSSSASKVPETSPRRRNRARPSSFSAYAILRRDLVMLISSDAAENSPKRASRQSHAMMILDNENGVPFSVVDSSDPSQAGRCKQLWAVSGMRDDADSYPQFFFDFIPVSVDEESGEVKVVSKATPRTVFWGCYDRFEKSVAGGMILQDLGLFSAEDYDLACQYYHRRVASVGNDNNNASPSASAEEPNKFPLPPNFIAASSALKHAARRSTTADDANDGSLFPPPPRFVPASSSVLLGNHNDASNKKMAQQRDFPAPPMFIAASQNSGAALPPRKDDDSSQKAQGGDLRYPPPPNFVAASAC